MQTGRTYINNVLAHEYPIAQACNCMGPQAGQPVCPCEMRFVRIIDGRYVKTVDLGPAPNGGLPDYAIKSYGLPNRMKAPADGKCCHQTVTEDTRCIGCPHAKV